ncbi:hypothetical protein AAFN86_28265 [Roseomonas sp. CAU 1739]|uniref:hypothetical protein n=1 Tax=Roseomonas sp. CAU 1739 TaxID=3140364 RepID=UPI00325A7352
MNEQFICPMQRRGLQSDPLSVAQIRGGVKASDGDRAWFAAHPGRNYRLRRAGFHQVALHPDLLTFVVVKQVRPGARVRAYFRGRLAQIDDASEAQAQRLFHDVMAHYP